MDCQRPNYFLCFSKMISDKDKTKDCTKRKILYEIRCLTCEKREVERKDEQYEDEKVRKEMNDEMKIPTYIGESSSSDYKHGYEHLDKLTSLHSQSHMLQGDPTEME